MNCKSCGKPLEGATPGPNRRARAHQYCSGCTEDLRMARRKAAIQYGNMHRPDFERSGRDIYSEKLAKGFKELHAGGEYDKEER